MSNLHLLCVACHRAKSGRERSRVSYPSTGDNVDGDTPRITPKEIPGIVASRENVVHITSDGILGGDYTLEPPRPYVKKRKRTQEGTVTDANEKLRQRFYRNKINASEVEDFNRFKVPLFVRAFHKAFPHAIVRERIASQLRLPDNSGQIYGISDKIREALELMGYKKMGVGGEKLDLKKMPATAKKEVENTITAIRAANIVRGSRAVGPLEEFKCYLKKVLGYNLQSHRVQRGAKKWRVYALVDMVPEKLLCNEIYSENWLQVHCKAVDKFVGSGHDEMALIRSLLLSATLKVAKNDMLPFKLNTGIDYTKPMT